MNTANQLSIIERYIAAYNRFDVDGMIEHLHPDVVFKNISNDEVNAETEGVGAFKELAEQSKALFSQRRQQVINHRFEQDSITVHIDFTGTLAMDLPDGPKAGEVLSIPASSEFVFADGKIIGITDII